MRTTILRVTNAEVRAVLHAKDFVVLSERWKLMFQQEEFPTIWGSSEEQAYWSLSFRDRPALTIEVPTGEEDPADVPLDTKFKLLQVWWTLGNENLLINPQNGH